MIYDAATVVMLRAILDELLLSEAFTTQNQCSAVDGAVSIELAGDELVLKPVIESTPLRSMRHRGAPGRAIPTIGDNIETSVFIMLQQFVSRHLLARTCRALVG